MKLNKIFIGLLVLSSMLLLVACTPEAQHEHTYATEWSSNVTSHWHAANCEHKTESKDKADHAWDEGRVVIEPTEEANGVKTYTCTVCGYTKDELVDTLPHTHKYSTEWSKDNTHHWYAPTCDDTEEVKDKAEHSWDEGVVTTVATCAVDGVKTYTCTVCGHTKAENLGKASEHIEGEEHVVSYVPGYKVTSYKECGAEISREAAFTYSHTYRDAALEQTVTEVLPVELVDGAYTFEFTTPQWGRIVMNIGDKTISSTEVTMLNGKAWDGGAYAGNYPLYHDGDTVTFLSATGGTYPVSYNPTTNELLLGKPVLPLPENGYNVQKLNGDSSLTVWTDPATVLRAADGTYPALPGQWTPWRLYVVVDAEGRVAYLCLFIPNGWGGAAGADYIRHSAYADYKTNPAFISLSEEYENQWGITCDWALGIPEGGFAITAHSADATALLKAILQDDTVEANDDNQGKVNTNANNVDNIRIKHNAENEWITIEVVEEEPTSNVVIGEFTDKEEEAGNLVVTKEGDKYVFYFDAAPTSKSRVYAEVTGHSLAELPYLKVTYSCSKAFNLSVYANGTSNSVLYYTNITDNEGVLILDLSQSEDVVEDGAVLELVLMVDRNGKHDASTYTTEDPTKTVYLEFDFVASQE